MIRVVALLMALFVSIPAYAQNWDEGGTLRDETVIGWAMSTDANKLASAADYIKASTEAGILATLKKGELKRASEDVAACMKEFAESANKPVTRENSTPYVLACMEKAKKKHPWMQLNPLASVQEAPQPSGEKWDISRATPVPYVVYSSGWDQKKTINRLKLFIRITPAGQGRDAHLGLGFLCITRTTRGHRHRRGKVLRQGYWGDLDQRCAGLPSGCRWRSLPACGCGLRTRRQGHFRQRKLDMEWSAGCRNALFRSGTRDAAALGRDAQRFSDIRG